MRGAVDDGVSKKMVVNIGEINNRDARVNVASVMYIFMQHRKSIHLRSPRRGNQEITEYAISIFPIFAANVLMYTYLYVYAYAHTYMYTYTYMYI